MVSELGWTPKGQKLEEDIEEEKRRLWQPQRGWLQPRPIWTAPFASENQQQSRGQPFNPPPEEDVWRPRLWGEKALELGRKGLEYLFYPATVSGIATKQLLEKEKEPLRFQLPWSPKGRESIAGEIEEMKGWLPSSETYREYREMPWQKQLQYETPFWGVAMALPGARQLRTALAGAAAKPGLAGALPTALRTALLPPAIAERTIHVGLKYGIGIPFEYGLAKPVAKGAKAAFEKALDLGLDKWLVRQGIRGEQAPKVIDWFLVRNNRWLYQRAEANWLKRLAEKKGVTQTAQRAAEDTVLEAEPLLLKAAEDAGVKIKPVTPTKAPEAVPKVTPEVTALKRPSEAEFPLWDFSKSSDAEVIAIWKAGQSAKTGIPAAQQNLAGAKRVLADAEDVSLGINKVVAQEHVKRAESALADETARFMDAEAEIARRGVAIPKPTAGEGIKPVGAPPKAVTPTAKPALMPEYAPEEIMALEAEAGGLREWLATEPSTRLQNLIKKTGWHKGEVSNLTIRQYTTLTGKTPKPSILTKDGKHIRWEYSLDDIATELGYKSGEELKYAIESTGEATIRLRGLERELTTTPPTLVDDIKTLYSELATEVKASQVAIKGLRGDEAQLARETLTGLKRELDYVERTLVSFAKRPDLPDATVLRQTIHAWARYKGISESALHDIYSSVAGRRQLRVIPQEQLVEILNRVKEARPKIIRGKTVITSKTERKIQTLKDSLTSRGQMTETDFARLLSDFNIDTPSYMSQYKFATESQGKTLLRAMIDESEWIARRTKVQNAIAEKPSIAKEVGNLDKRIDAEKVISINGEKIEKVFPLQDTRYYVMSLEAQTGAPFYGTWQWLNEAHLENRYRRRQYFTRLEQSTPRFEDIAKDDIALKRVNDFIASKHKEGPKRPLDITEDEIKLASEIETQLREFQTQVRLAKFEEGYELYPDNIQQIKRELIPNAPIEDLRKAIDIYEGKGRDALTEYLATRSWGVQKSGYEPLSVVNPRVYLRPARPQTFGKGHIQVRRGTQYSPQDRNILQRLNSYTKQMLSLTDLSPAVRKFLRVFDENSNLLANPSQVGSNLARAINESKGYSEVGGAMGVFMSRLYAQTMSAVFLDPFKWLRNKCQNLAFHPDRARYFDPAIHKVLPEQDLIYLEVYISQLRGLKEDYLMQQFKPFPGLDRITKLANRVNAYPWTDESNRMEAYQMRKNRVSEALATFDKDRNLDTLIKKAGLQDLEPIQQKEALGLLAQDTVEYPIADLESVTGKEAFARYIAKEVTNNTHFMYERSQRAPAEMGALGRIIGNLLVFPRSYLQRLILQGRKLKPSSKASGAEKSYALKTIVGIIVCGALIGEAFKRVTGRTYNPYHPFNILGWSPGGLTIGAAEELSSSIFDIANAVIGDKTALGRFTSSLPRAARLFIPFYRQFIFTLEAATDTKNLDRYALRKLRSAIDSEYEPRAEAYKLERDFLAKMQHILFGGEAPEEEAEEPTTLPTRGRPFTPPGAGEWEAPTRGRPFSPPE